MRTKGAVKLHLLLDHEGYLPTFVRITDGKTSEVAVGRDLKLPRESIVVVDRGYTDYSLFAQWGKRGIWFVTRPRRNMDYRVLERRPVPDRTNVLCDEIIKLASSYGRARHPLPLRRIEVVDRETGGVPGLLTNQMDLAASTIARIYRDRWQIETFFRALKQNLRIKSFRRHRPKCRADSDLDDTHRDAVVEVSPVQIQAGFGPCRIWWRCSDGTCLPTGIYGNGSMIHSKCHPWSRNTSSCNWSCDDLNSIRGPRQRIRPKPVPEQSIYWNLSMGLAMKRLSWTALGHS